MLTYDDFIATPIGYELSTWFGSDIANKCLKNITINDTLVATTDRVKNLFDIDNTPEDVAIWNRVDISLYNMNNICLRGPSFTDTWHIGAIAIKRLDGSYNFKYIVESAHQTDLSTFDFADVGELSINSTIVVYDTLSAKRYLWDGMTQNIYAAMPVKEYEIGIGTYPTITGKTSNLTVTKGNLFYLFIQAVTKAMTDRGFIGSTQNFIDQIIAKQELPVMVIVEESDGYGEVA